MGVSNKTFDSTVLKSNGAKKREGGIAGVVVDAGQWVYLNTATNRYELAQGDTEAKAEVAGMAEHPANIGQPLDVIWEGPVTGLTGLTAGETYTLSDDSAGDAMAIGDLATNHWVTTLGTAPSATTFDIKIHRTGVQHA